MSKGKMLCLRCRCNRPDCDIELGLPAALATRVRKNDFLAAVSPGCLATGQVANVKCVVEEDEVVGYAIVELTCTDLPPVGDFEKPFVVPSDGREVVRCSSRFSSTRLLPPIYAVAR